MDQVVDDDSNFFDPSDLLSMLLPQRRLSPAAPGSFLLDVDSVDSLLAHSKGSGQKLAFKQRSQPSSLTGSALAFTLPKVLWNIYSFCGFKDQTLHARVSRPFLFSLRSVPLSVLASGPVADEFCLHVFSLLAPYSAVVSLSLGCENDALRGPAVSSLRAGFSRSLFPSLRAFHVTVHSSLGEEGIFTLIDSMLKGGIPSLTSLDFSGNYIGAQSSRRLSKILLTGRFSGLRAIDLSRNGLSEVGTNSVVKALCGTNPLTMPSLTSLNLSRNDMGSGFLSLPKALKTVLNKTLLKLNLSSNNIQPEDMSAAFNLCHGTVGLHTITHFDISWNSLTDTSAGSCVGLFFGSGENRVVRLDMSGVEGQHRFATAIGTVIAGGGFATLEASTIVAAVFRGRFV